MLPTDLSLTSPLQDFNLDKEDRTESKGPPALPFSFLGTDHADSVFLLSSSPANLSLRTAGAMV